MTDKYSEEFKVKLSPKAQQWLNDYKPKELTWFGHFLAKFSMGSNTRPATLEQDRFFLDCIAEQCDKQKVRFPKPPIGVF